MLNLSRLRIKLSMRYRTGLLFKASLIVVLINIALSNFVITRVIDRNSKTTQLQ